MNTLSKFLVMIAAGSTLVTASACPSEIGTQLLSNLRNAAPSSLPARPESLKYWSKQLQKNTSDGCECLRALAWVKSDAFHTKDARLPEDLNRAIETLTLVLLETKDGTNVPKFPCKLAFGDRPVLTRFSFDASGLFNYDVQARMRSHGNSEYFLALALRTNDIKLFFAAYIGVMGVDDSPLWKAMLKVVRFVAAKAGDPVKSVLIDLLELWTRHSARVKPNIEPEMRRRKEQVEISNAGTDEQLYAIWNTIRS